MEKAHIDVRLLGQADELSWNSFLDTAPGSSLYHRFEWKRIMEASLGHQTFYLAAFREGSISGVLPLVFIRSRLFGRILCSMPFLNYGGICALNEVSEKALVQRTRGLVEDLGADYAEIRGASKLAKNLPTSTRKVSMTLNLADDPDEIWNSYSSKHRTQIRRSYKNGLEVRSGGAEMLDIFYGILSESFRNLGTPLLSKGFFGQIIESFEDSIRIYVVYHGKVPVAAAMNGHYRATVEGMWAGIHPNAIRLGPVYVLYWEMIKDACQDGYRLYHMGRSTAGSGGEFYKSKWKATTSQLYWQYCMGNNKEIPEVNVENPKYRLFINLWKKLPLSLANSLGPPLARKIP